MIRHGGILYFPYLLIIADQEPVLGLDVRGMADVEGEWIDKATRGAKRHAALAQAAIRAEVANERLLQRKVERDDPVLTPEGVSDGVELSEVARPPVEAPDQDEVLRLAGMPGGYGAASVMATRIVGVVRAWGDYAEDICAIVQEVRIPARSEKKQQRKGGRR